jgi:hypothetical protein
MSPLLFGAYGCDPLLGHGSIAGGHPVVLLVLQTGGGGDGNGKKLEEKYHKKFTHPNFAKCEKINFTK